MPVIALAEGGVRETVEDGVNGYLVDDTNEMAETVVKLLGNKEHREQMGNTARKNVVEIWSWEKAFDRLEKLLQEADQQGEVIRR
jgi:glycosyltransferase involved in cell wall biosynthesis